MTLDKPNNMREDIYEIITNCWDNNPNERITIDEVIALLSQLK